MSAGLDPRGEAAPGGPDTRVALAALFALALAFRLVTLPGSTPANMDPDAAHFLNVARCFERGQGFSNVGAWPAWMKPDSLPMPETFKEPGYPWLIWKLQPLAGGDPFRAGVWISMFGGLALPLLLYALARTVTRDRTVAFAAGLLAASSPLLVAQSVRVMVDSLYPAMSVAAFALLAWRPGGRRPWALDVAAGAAFGAAFLLRGGALMLVPALLVMAFTLHPPRRALGALALALAAAAAVASPFIARNLRLFHTWFHSDVGAYGIWPYVDPLTFNAGLERPPAPIAFALGHLPQVAKHWVASAAQFALHTFPDEILAAPWLLPLAAGLLLGFRRFRAHAWAYLFVLGIPAFIFALHWDSRYFAGATAMACLFAGHGAAWMWRRLGPERVGPVSMRLVLAAVCAFTLAGQLHGARQWVRRFDPPESLAARTLAPEIARRLAPGESVMVMTTSFYAWYADRPSVHLVISDTPRFLDTLRRLKVRLAVLPTGRLAEFAARYEGGRLPAALVRERDEPGLGVTVFRVELAEGAAGLEPAR